MVNRKHPVFMQDIMRGTLVTGGEPEGQLGCHRVVTKLQYLKGTSGECLKTASCHGVPKSTAAVTNQLTTGISYFPLVPHIPIQGMAFVNASGSDGLIGAANVYDAVKRGKRAEEMGDSAGQVSAAVDGVASGTLVVASGVGFSLKFIEALQEVSTVAHHPIAMSGAVIAAQGVLGFFSKIALGLYYGINGLKYAFGLISWIQGRSWRKKLLASGDPMMALRRELMERVEKTDRTKEDDIKLALHYGARWLGKIEEASEGRLKIKDKKEAFRKLVLSQPELIQQLIGESVCPLTPEGELIRFGIYMAEQNICAKFEAECERKLGKEAVEAMHTQDSQALQEALHLKEWVGYALKIGVAVIGVVALVALAIVLSGTPIGVALILAAIVGITMIFVTDFKALKEHFQDGEFKKRDRVFFYVTLVLSVISFLGLVGLTIASGGIAPFVVALFISSIWIGIQLFTAYTLWRYDHRRWKVKKVVDITTYRKFLQTRPQNVAEVWAKLDPRIKDDFDPEMNKTLEEYQAEERRIAEVHRRQLDDLIAALQAMV